jgi:serine/threonine protein kinase
MYPVGTPFRDEYGYWSSVGWSFVFERQALSAVKDGILTLDVNGSLASLYLFNSTYTENLASVTVNSTKQLCRLTIDPDGILRLYSHNGTQTGNWTVAWSRPGDGCAPKGLCGLNEYCVLNPAVDCQCLPGFAPVKEGDWGSGSRGTQGYIAPEWHQQPPMITDKVDVYSFGIVLLEIISCRKSIDSNLPDDEVNLKRWANHCFDRGELGKLVNNEEIDKRELEKMVKIGLWCTSDEFPLRPSMKKVLHVLEGIENIPESASSISSLISI